MNKGMLIIISGPSGSGKGTVVKKLRDSEDISLSISYTTRAMRPGEVDGESYYFISKDTFMEMLAEDEFLESASFVGNYYGTPRSFVMDQIDNGKTVILEIEVNGAIQVKEKFPDCILIFLIPPTIDELRARLINRKTEDLETIQERMKRAIEEVALINKYDYIVINDEVDNAITDLQNIIKAEKLKPMRSHLQIERFKCGE